MKEPTRILVVRPDRIGDFVLTVPSVEALRRAYPGARIDALLSPRVAPLAGMVKGLDSVLRDPGGFWPLVKGIRSGRFDTAVFPYGSIRTVAAAAAGGIRRRIGNGYRSYAPLLTDRVRLRRAHPKIHEVDYCLRLLGPLAVPVPHRPEPRLALPESVRQEGRRVLDRTAGEGARVILVHPGGGGSAGRPAPETFARYAGALAAPGGDPPLSGSAVLVSTGPGEETLARKVANACGGTVLPPVGDVLAFAGVLAGVDLVMAASTGPLHLAAALGTAVIGFYPWRANQASDRWGPRGARARALSPDREGCEECRSGLCAKPVCFERVSDAAVREAARALTRGKPPFGQS
jgi:ADP-heptose:LPS heptosyltransferase